MSWADDMQKHADYFCKKFDEQEDWFFPDHLEENASYPTAKEDVQRLFAEFGRFIDVEVALEGVSEEISLLSKAADDIDQDFCEGVLNDIDLYLENWEGDAADGFRSYLRGQPSIEGALARKRDVVRAAKYAMQAYEKSITSFRDDVLNFVEKAQKGVEAGEIRDAKVMISLASAAVSIGVAAATAGTGVAFIATLAVGDALQTGAAGVNATYLEANSTEQVIGEMGWKGQDILETGRRQMEKVRAGFRAVAESMAGAGMLELSPPRPRLVTDDRFDPGDFHQEDRKPPSRISREDLVEEPKEPDSAPARSAS
ncbi:hypothetical protein V1227_34460 [Lentzea sp. DG1S-22]|uniref:hypothetical protein n=1 Tax=Lentzea sp. DG1S-22 TaxID=3108822 RepID=UPI002E793D6D|nr:hypothetical protein [Lentzea sp. DG1S-22]WVH80070.1 hypothetical protein V1227_34460 [Lentzea sp. DG1S-22]